MAIQSTTSRQLRCLIVEDEPIAQDLLTELVEQNSLLELTGVASNAVEALDLYLKTLPDLLLLDIHLPGITGLDLLRSLATHKPFVIITTASQQHALEGFELDVVDYLLKPVSADRLNRAVNKMLERMRPVDDSKSGTLLNSAIKPTSNPTSTESLTVKDGRSIVQIPYNEIILFEAMDDYVKIIMVNRFVMTLCSLSRLEKLLPRSMFSRISRSHIVRHQAVRRIDHQSVELMNGRLLNISRTKYRQNVQTLVQLLL